MPLRLEIKKKLTQRSDRVKSVDMHPTEPWVLCALYSGKVVIYNYNTSTTVKTFDVSEFPVRCARFIARKQWIICGSDDMLMRVFNINTLERVAQFEGHQDYIRFLEVHPTQPLILSSSDDMSVRMWDWERNWSTVQSFEGHAHYVMMVKINPKDTNTFATASLDRSVKVWSLSAATPNFSLEGHERGVNCVDYFPGGDKPYIVSGADDQTLRVWDYQTRSCVATLEGHTNNVCAVAFHPRLPVVLSGSEDGTVRVWHNTTYRLETTLNYGFERAWAVSCAPGTNKVALGYDDGTIVVKLGKDMPVSSMDKNGKIIIARNNVVFSASIRAGAAAALEDDGASAAAVSAPAAAPAVDGEAITVSEKELGSVELFPVNIQHNSNGRFVAVVGDNEYVIYTAQALRNKSFGTALDFVWSAYGTGDYAVRESTTRIKVFKNFKETHAFRPSVSAEGLYGGALLCVRSTDALLFYDWDSDKLVRRIEVSAKAVYWNESGELLTVATDEDSFYVLRFSRDAYTSAVAAAAPGSAEAAVIAEEGVEAAFELQHEITEKVRGAAWVGDCFLYTNAANRLNYYVGGEVITLAHLDRHMYMMGYLAKEGRVYLMDKTGAIVSYGLLLAMLEYQTAVVRRDFAAANGILASIPREQYNGIARFLDSQGFKEEALAVADDTDLKFDLAVQLGKLDYAINMLKTSMDADAADLQSKWKVLMDLSLAKCDIVLAEQCAVAARDLSGLLLIYSSTGNAAGMKTVAEMGREDGRVNIAFAALHMLGRVEDAARLLAESGRVAEAVFFARTYAPSLISELMPQWKADVAKHSKRAADALADPTANADKFVDMDVALRAEAVFVHQRDHGPVVPASVYPSAKADLELDLLSTIKAMLASGTPLPGAPSSARATPAVAVTSPKATAPVAAAAAASPTPTPVPASAPVAAAATSPQPTSARAAAFAVDGAPAATASSQRASSGVAAQASFAAPVVAPAAQLESPPRATATVPAASPAAARAAASPVPAPVPPAPAPAPVIDDLAEFDDLAEDTPAPAPAARTPTAPPPRAAPAVASPAPAARVVSAPAPAPAAAEDDFDIDESEWS